MDSLTSSPAADVLSRLFDEAIATDRTVIEDQPGGAMADAELIRGILEEEAKDYKGLYRRYADNFLSVSPEFGKFLYICARACGAKLIVEYGTSFGVSTIHLASALRDGSGGRLIGTELEPTKVERARRNLDAAGLGDLVELRTGDALETLRNGIEGSIDLVLLDGAFSLYLPVLKLLEPHLRPGSLVIGENAIEPAAGYLDYVRDSANGYLSLTLPFDAARGNELSIRTA